MSTALVPFNEVREMAVAAAKSAFFAGVGTPEQALTLMMLAQAEGCHPIQAMQRYHVIKGKPSKQAHAMLADFIAAGGKVEWIAHGPERCAATFSHPQGGTITVDWNIERARNAGLLGNDTWKKYPESMLHARVVSNGVKFVYPAATGGLYEPGEVADFAPEPRQTPEAAPATATAARAEKAPPVQPSSVWDQFKPEAPVDAEFEDVAMPMSQPAELTMPGDVCIRVPEEIASKSRKLSGAAFDVMPEEELVNTITELQRMAQGAKSPHNRGVLTVVATFAKQALAARQMPVAP